MSSKLDGCSAYVYDTEGNMLATVKIHEYDDYEQSIEVSDSQVLQDNLRCELLVLSSPIPYAYSGMVHTKGHKLHIKLFRGREKESRNAVRYKLTGKASITAYICEGKKYGLHTPIEVTLINISTRGVRFSTRYNMLSIGDKFTLQLKINDSIKVLTAEVVNIKDIERESSEYGCILVGEYDE